ncbi:MAG TPA: CPBP family intramembrane glutamic endopeptidase, partial [Rhodoglobus sp.]|nr:CPBP family intramembrane glutamic endopeptidase [Rhodoglobus sp.]
SRSAYIAADPEEQAAVTARVDAVLDGVGGERFALPYRTHVYRSVLQPDRAYDHALHGVKRGWWRGAVAIVSFLVLFLGVNTVIGGIGFAIDAVLGNTDLEQLEQGVVPLTPIVMLANNLSLAAAIPIAWLLQWALFGVRPRFLSSVIGGFRWRWMLRLAIVIVPVWAVYVSLSLLGATELQFDGTVVAVIVITLLTTPFQAAGEEYGLRGLVQRSVGSWFAGPRVAFVVSTAISAIVFGALHFAGDPWLIAYYVIFGVAMSIAAHFTGGIEASVLIHATNNVLLFVVAAVLGQLAAGIDRSAGTGGPFILIPTLLVLAAALFAAWRARRTGVVRRAPSPPAT